MKTTEETATANAEVNQAFSDLDRARETLRIAQDALRINRNALRRYARARCITVRAARDHMFSHNRAQYTALVRAECDHDFALRTFRRIAMIAALTRVIDTDRRLNAAA